MRQRISVGRDWEGEFKEGKGNSRRGGRKGGREGGRGEFFDGMKIRER